MADADTACLLPCTDIGGKIIDQDAAFPFAEINLVFAQHDIDMDVL